MDAHHTDQKRRTANPPLSYRPNEACRLLSIGRTKLYQLIANGDLETFSIGRARLIRAESLHRLAGSRVA